MKASEFCETLIKWRIKMKMTLLWRSSDFENILWERRPACWAIWTGDEIVIQGNTPKLLQRGKACSRESLGKTMIQCPSYLRVRRMLWWNGESPPSISSDTESCPFFKTKLLHLLKGSPLVAFLESGRQSTSQACCLDEDRDSQGHRSTKPPSSHWQLTEQLKLHASRQNRLS